MDAPFRTHNGFVWHDGRVVCHTDERHANVVGTVHGGVGLTMLDSVMGGAVIQALPDDQVAVTVSMTSQFLSPARVGDVLVASAEIQRLGRSLAFVDATLRRASDERVLVTASGVFAVVPSTGAVPDRRDPAL